MTKLKLDHPALGCFCTAHERQRIASRRGAANHRRRQGQQLGMAHRDMVEQATARGKSPEEISADTGLEFDQVLKCVQRQDRINNEDE